MEFLLDTNAFVHIARDDQVAQILLSGLGLVKNNPVIASSITLGEIEFFGRHRGWNKKTVENMRMKMSSAFIINPDSRGVPSAYATIQYETRILRKPALANRDNDVWIAACALATGSCLVSSDKWYQNIGGSLIDLAFYDAKSGEVTFTNRVK